jgi:hypothetical protein
MEIKYSNHLEQRLILRGIGHELPALIFNQSADGRRAPKDQTMVFSHVEV